MQFFNKQINNNKSTTYTFFTLYGISKHKAKQISSFLNLGLDCKCSDLQSKDFSKLVDFLEKKNILFDKNLKDVFFLDNKTSKRISSFVYTIKQI